MAHRNAPLTETGRLRLARCVVEDGWPLRRAAERFQVSPTTAQRWAERYRELRRGRDGRPLVAARTTARAGPRPAPSGGSSRSVSLRRWGPARIALPAAAEPSTVHRVLARYRLARLAAPGPGHRPGRSAATNTTRPATWSTSTSRSSATSPTAAATGSSGRAGRPQQPRQRRLRLPAHRRRRPLPPGLHRDPRRRDEGRPPPAFWHRAQAFFAAAGITVERVLTDNGCLLPLRTLARRPGRSRDHPQAHPALPAADQRQSRTLQPHPARRMGLRPALPLRTRTTRSLPRLAPHLQPPPRPHRTERPTTRQPRPQPNPLLAAADQSVRGCRDGCLFPTWPSEASRESGTFPMVFVAVAWIPGDVFGAPGSRSLARRSTPRCPRTATKHLMR